MKLKHILAFVFILGLSGCGGSATTEDDSAPVSQVPPVVDDMPPVTSEVPSDSRSMSSFSFLMENNPGLDADVTMSALDGVFSGRVETNTSVNELVASFQHDGASVSLDGELQTSGVKANDFSDILTYTVTASDGQKASYSVDLTKFTGLPIIYLKTDDYSPIDSKENYVKGDVWVDGGRNFTNFVESGMKIRGRGNSTWFLHPKKPFQMKLDEKAEFLGMPEAKKWLFLAEYSDKTMLRNKTSFEMGYLSSLGWTPQSRFAEVYINNEYSGTYNVTEKVEENDNRVALGDTGYLLEIDQLERMEPDDVYFNTNEFLINIKEPSVDLDSAEYHFIKDLINEFEDVLFGNNYANPLEGYAKYIDIDSFIDWYLIGEITKNADYQSFSSIYLNVLPGEKIKMGPLWDFDLSLGNENHYPDNFWVKDHRWYQRLFQDPAFVSKVKARFEYFKENQNIILDKIDANAEKLKWAQQENDNKWKTMGNYVWPNSVVFDTYQEEVDHLKAWYSGRIQWLDEAFLGL